MPAGPRVRGNNSYGITTDNPLTIGATSFNSAGLSTLPVVSSAHAVITLDPLRQFGEPEIVVVTAHTASATVATITRGQYGTVARAHPQNTVWVHAPIDEDVIEVLTSGTRPSNPYEGQFIFETDTNKLVGFGGADWAPRDAGGTLGYAQVVVSQNGIGTGGPHDLTGLSISVTVGTGRRIRITGQGLFIQQGASSATTTLRLNEGANELQRLGHTTMLPGQGEVFCGVWSGTPSAGVHTYKLVANTTINTMDLFATANIPAYILAEDIGAA